MTDFCIRCRRGCARRRHGRGPAAVRSAVSPIDGRHGAARWRRRVDQEVRGAIPSARASPQKKLRRTTRCGRAPPSHGVCAGLGQGHDFDDAGRRCARVDQIRVGRGRSTKASRGRRPDGADRVRLTEAVIARATATRRRIRTCSATRRYGGAAWHLAQIVTGAGRRRRRRGEIPAVLRACHVHRTIGDEPDLDDVGEAVEPGATVQHGVDDRRDVRVLRHVRAVHVRDVNGRRPQRVVAVSGRSACRNVAEVESGKNAAF